ncbi:MurR/RpiR family transcriptional regulator [Mollicutes bacterium LVI A0078]|nr:MurR/RpiR family transcriptional regulator [Mollicutes bacterium LVI A0075]WOO91363.1 MurR/RpiR family transcriptional regulator [Mollicutes bacterium LVI A0078]
MKNIIPKLEKISVEHGNMGLLANYLLNYEGNLSELKVKDICDDLYISVASATRLAKHMGLNGFSELKTYLAIEKTQNNISNASYQSSDAKDYYNTTCIALDNTLKVIDMAIVESLAISILESTRVNLFGIGESNLTLQDFGHKLKRIGFLVNFQADAHLQFVEASTSDQNTVAIALSYSGLSKDVLNCMRVSKSSDAKTVMITSNELLEEEYIDNYLLIGGKEASKRSFSFESRICTHAILDLVFLKILELKPELKSVSNANRYQYMEM